MMRVGVCGHFGGDETFLDGQTIKTKTVTNELEKCLKEKILTIDTYGPKWETPLLILKLIRLYFNCKNIIIFPAQNSLRIFAPLLIGLKGILHRRLHYVVIGGWLPKFLYTRHWLKYCLMRFDYIYVETATIKRAMEQEGFGNIIVMPNCKQLRIVSEKEMIYADHMPYKLCTFSRVIKEKGIETAVTVVKKLNEKRRYTAFTLDIYGQIDPGYQEEFTERKKNFPEFINYMGEVPFNQSINILKEYFALLFPTQYFTEGIPGTIIDAYAAGIPVIAAKWENFSDVVEEGVIGKGYEFGDCFALEKLLDEVIDNPNELLLMKGNCILYAKRFLPKEVIKNTLLYRLKAVI